MPAITQSITVRLPPELYQAIKQAAKHQDVSLNEYIREVLQDRIDALKEAKEADK